MVMVRFNLPAPLREKLEAGHWLRTAHRGAPLVAPGNSARALEAAAMIGVDLIEVDLHVTRDGRLLLWHDDDVHGVDGTKTVIATSSLAVLQGIDIGDGQRIITLETGIEIARGHCGLMIDLKAEGLAKSIVQTLRHLEFAPVIVCGGYRETLQEIQALGPSIGTSLTLTGDWRTAYGITDLEIGTPAVTIDGRLLYPDNGGPELLERLHAQNIAVLAWTIDKPEDMHACLAAGVNGLTSNRPDLLAQLPNPYGVERMVA
jgi:glycerophosphoryl diester phosphodiesterase